MPSRRDFLRSGTLSASLFVGASSLSSSPLPNARPLPDGIVPEFAPLLTPADQFRDVSRGNPKPHTLSGDALVQAGLTEQTWRLEIVADSTTDELVKEATSVERQFTVADGTAIDLPRLQQLFTDHGVRYLKAIQCLNIPQPLGQGLWEGVPLSEVLRLCGRMRNVRRVYYSGFHNNDPQQIFQSSLSYTQAVETAPGDPPVFLAWKLNGEPIPLERGGPVRMVVPWAYGFKSIKWLQRITLTNDHRANDTYAKQNNDPDSPMKTAAYLEQLPERFSAGDTILMSGQVVSGFSGLQHVEGWLRRVEESAAPVEFDGDEWRAAEWRTCVLEPEPAHWGDVLPSGVSSHQLVG
ncbi:MAG: molybdopterin-dependent oxidoreductase, partial [Planctomycetaceae bacterium]|nr:molybdopterin-dependent oxidoreductase [Planctomycetaceae bacterium]